jgi:predicted amidohydrolase YtcJ
VLRSRDEGEGGEAAPVLGLSGQDWLLENARVVTLDPARPVADAIAIGGGRVLAVGPAAALRRLAGTRTERVDCKGATILPGLVDPHLHLFALAARHANLDCATSASLAALLAAVRARAGTLPRDAWVRGEGLDEARFARLPTAAELDLAAGGRPVRLRHRSRHASVLSTAALRCLGNGPGIERRDGVATGLVSGREETLGRLVGPLPGAALAAGLAAAARELAALGVTTVADATPRRWRGLAPLRAAIESGAFPLRVFAMRPPGSPRWRPTGRLLPGPVKVMVEETDGGLRPRAATLARRIAVAAARGEQIAVHCVGAATLVAALAAFAALPARQRSGRRHRLEHLGECPPPLIARIAVLSLAVVTNPAFVFWRGDRYLEETGGQARAWLYRAATLARAGVRLAAASDAPVVPPSPWIGMAAARLRRTASGATLGRGERLGAGAALGLFTTGAAFALRDDRLGRILSGGPADLVVVEPDPLRASPDEMAGARVLLTLAGGNRVWPP